MKKQSQSTSPKTDALVEALMSLPRLEVLQAEHDGKSYGQKWQAGVKALWANLLKMSVHAKDTEAELTRLQKENDLLTKALEMYTDPTAWFYYDGSKAWVYRRDEGGNPCDAAWKRLNEAKLVE